MTGVQTCALPICFLVTIIVATVEINIIGLEAQEVEEIAFTLRSSLATGTYETIVFNAIVYKNTVLQEPESGNGEETTPFISQTTIEIYYKE